MLLNEILSRGGELKTSKVNSFKHTPKSVKSKVDSNAKTEKVTHKRKASLVQTKKNLSLAKEGYNAINNTAFSGEGLALEINDIEVGLEIEPINYK